MYPDTPEGMQLRRKDGMKEIMMWVAADATNFNENLRICWKGEDPMPHTLNLAGDVTALVLHRVYPEDEALACYANGDDKRLQEIFILTTSIMLIGPGWEALGIYAGNFVSKWLEVSWEGDEEEMWSWMLTVGLGICDSNRADHTRNPDEGADIK